MTDADAVLAVFSAERGHLFAVAYRMLGSVADAEDAVQDAWLRWQRADHDAVREPASYLTTVVTRLCLDRLGAARRRRETYVGPWLPEPLVTEPDVAERTEQADSVSMALLVILETLSPAERSVFVLHDVFGHPYAEVAEIVERTEAACRQLGHRARRHVEARRPRFDPSPRQRWRTAEAFLTACEGGDVAQLLGLLAEDATVWSDGGGVVAAARRPIHGADAVARFLVGIARHVPAGAVHRRCDVNGQPGLVVEVDGASAAVMSLDVRDGRVRAVRIVVNPEKLRELTVRPR